MQRFTPYIREDREGFTAFVWDAWKRRCEVLPFRYAIRDEAEADLTALIHELEERNEK